MIEAQSHVTNLSLNQIYSVSATAEEDVYIVSCNITDINGNTYDVQYGSRPDDVYGLNPAIRQWLEDNKSITIQPFDPPTAEQIRANMPALTARQFRLGLVNSGFALRRVVAAIDAMPSEVERETAAIEWEYGTAFNRSDPLINTVGAALGLAEEQLDAIGLAAVDF